MNIILLYLHLQSEQPVKTTISYYILTYFSFAFVPDCICEEAEKVCNDSVAPYMSSILEALTENISVGIQEMQQTLQTRMDAAFANTNERTEETKKVTCARPSIKKD